mmetsp:Transcript_35010/g.93856  ORF Transcript_35010/g.93856 Transcript_35010/m.93856 type:complete len:220 (-) Transcript_35010:45-704(-)
MPLHSVVITNPSGVLLLSRYWGGGAASWSTEGSQARAQWERSLWAAAAPWPTAAGQPKSPDSGMGVVDEFAMVWRQIGELVVFVAGDDEYDELILESEVFPLVEALLREHCGGKLVESTLLHYDTYGKVSDGSWTVSPPTHTRSASKPAFSNVTTGYRHPTRRLFSHSRRCSDKATSSIQTWRRYFACRSSKSSTRSCSGAAAACRELLEQIGTPPSRY